MRLSQSLRAHSDALRDRGAARHQTTVYGSCGLQGRGRQLHVASRTGSHAFPRDLRGSHPRHHGGNGEKVENGVAPGEGDAAQRERVGKRRTGRRSVCLPGCEARSGRVCLLVPWKNTTSPPPSFCFLRAADSLPLFESLSAQQAVRAGRFHFLRIYGDTRDRTFLSI